MRRGNRIRGMTYAALLLAAVLAPGPAPAKAPAAAPKPPPGAAAAAAPADEPMPTPQDVRKALDGGSAAEALRLLGRLLPLKGKAAAGLDRYELLTLKAEAHLRTKAVDAAAQAFRQAAEQTENKEQAAVARASEQLVRRSRGLAYIPKHPPKGKAAVPIEVADPEKRKAALQAMFADEMAELAPKVKLAKAARTLPPALKVMQSALELKTLELAANGSAEQVDGIVEELKTSCKDLLARTMEKATKKVDQITDMANDTERVRQIWPSPYGGYTVQAVDRRRGLRRQDISELKAIADVCDEVAAAAKAVAKASRADELEYEDQIDQAEDLRMHVRRMLRSHDIEY